MFKASNGTNGRNFVTKSSKHWGTLRVLFVADEKTLSGAPLPWIYLAESLHRQGWDIMLAAPASAPIVDLFHKAGIHVELDASLLADPLCQKLRGLVRECDVVVANTILSWPAVETAYRENVSVIWNLHETVLATGLITQYARARDALHLASVIVVPTWQRAHVLKGATQARIEIIPHGIPDRSDIETNAKVETVSFVALGDFQPSEGQDVLVDAIGRLDSTTRRKTSSSKSPAEYWDRLNSFDEIRDRAAGWKNVEVIESLDHKDTIRLLANSDALISSSRDTTMPITMIEAASLSKVIISTEVGGVGEWIHDGLNGLACSGRKNSTALANAIVRCTQDRQLRARLGAAAKRTFDRHFRLEKFVSRFSALLDHLKEKDIPPLPRSYESWIKEYERSTPGDRIELQRRLGPLHLVSR